jgi:hypothetical protein
MEEKLQNLRRCHRPYDEPIDYEDLNDNIEDA